MSTAIKVAWFAKLIVVVLFMPAACGRQKAQSVPEPAHSSLTGPGFGRSLATMNRKVHRVLIADDSEVERFLLKRALQNGAPRLEVISELETGDEVIAYLAGDGPFADRAQHPLPQLVFLDLRMPRKGGLEVLEWLRNRPKGDFKVAVLADSSGTMFRS